MNGFTIICIVIWIVGAYRYWGAVGKKDWEWINRKEPLNYVAKGALCILVGFFYVVYLLFKLAMKLISLMF